MRLIQEGPRDAKIIIVGEAPGEREAASGVPFSGGAGTLLNQMLSRCGIDRAQCFVTNVCHVRPPENKFEWFYKKENQIHFIQGVLQLQKDITEIRPNLVISLGTHPLRVLTDRVGIDKWRGSILSSTLVPGIKVIGTYHPAAIMRVYDYKAVAEFDLRRAAHQSSFSSILRPDREFYLNPTDHGVKQGLVTDMLSAQWLSVDIECWQNDIGGWSLACVGFSDKPSRALVLDAKDQTNLEFIRQLCESPIPKILQNGTFDATVLASNHIRLCNFSWDTMLAHHSLFPECATGADEMSVLAGTKRQAALSKGLKFLTSIYTEEPFYKDDGKTWKQTGDIEIFYRYNALDAAVTHEIKDVQVKELSSFGTMGIFQHEMSLVEPLMQMTARGIKIDEEKRSAQGSKIAHEIINLQSFLDSSAGRPINVKSSKDVQDLLYNQLRLPTQRNRLTGNPSVDKYALETLGAKFPEHPILHTILEIRERRDLLERYILAPTDSDGRIRCSFDITGTRTGRLASRQSIYGSGTNLQTIPEELRSFFVADPGYVFVYKDYSQAEARVVAYLAQCSRLIDLFNNPTRDIHRENAARIFNVPIAQVTKDQRFLAKKGVHSANYAVEAPRIAAEINQIARETGVRISTPQAQRILDAYFMLYPEIKSVYWSGVRDALYHTRTLVSAFGRKRTFFGRYDDKLVRDAYSWQPQSTVGDLGTMALVRIHKEIPQAQLLLNVHDSILVQCAESDVGTVVSEMNACMAIPITINDCVFTIPTDTFTGRNWGYASPENPDGLEKYVHPA